MSIVIRVENLFKQYRLGTIGTGSIAHDINRWLHSIAGKEDPYLKVTEENKRVGKEHSDYVWALQDINFEVKSGEVLGIIGKNGAGKSTLLKILSKVTGPTKGQIKIKGRVASLLEVGTGFQQELTGRANVFLNGAILGMTQAEIKRKFDQIIDFSGIENYIDTPVKRYSSGMYVRLAFAVAAHLEPEILIIDEVLAVGDDEFQKKCLGKMKDVSDREGRTVLFVSHNMAAVRNLCPRSLLLENGKLALDSNTDEVMDHYHANTNETFDASLIEESRTGDRRVVISGISIHGGKANSTMPALSGEDLYLKFNFTRQCDKYKTARLSVQIDDFEDKTVAWISTWLYKMEDKINVDKPLTFVMKKCLFNSGRFYLSYKLEIDGSVSDMVKNAIKFDVHPHDYYGTGILVPPNMSSVWMPFEVLKQ